MTVRQAAKVTNPRTVVDLADCNRIASRYGLPHIGTVPAPWVGATSRVYPLHDTVLKVPFATPDAIASLATDTAVSVEMRRRGVETPELLAYDQSLEIVPVPFALYRRVPDSVTLERAVALESALDAWRELGRQLAIIHAVTDPEAFPAALRSFRQTAVVDPRPWAETLRNQGALHPNDATWLQALLDDVAPVVLASEPMTLCHGDVNAANVLVHRETGAFLALIDWAGAGWLDPAWDFVGVPLKAVPAMLAGHRSVRPFPSDDAAEARIFWCRT